MPASIANPLRDAGRVGAFGDWLRSVNDFLGFRILNTGGLRLTVGALLAALVVFLIALTASWILRVGLRRYAARHHTNKATLYTLSRLAHYILLVVGLLIALNVAGVKFSQFVVFAGALGVGLGFGLQAIFSNFISGLIILFDRSLKVGDFVELGEGVRGEVRDIRIRATRITTNDNIDILVPNSKFITDNVVNWTFAESTRRQRIPFGVAYEADKELVRKAALEAAASVPFTLAQDGPRRPQLRLTGFGDSSIHYMLMVWLTPEAVKHPGGAAAAYNWALHTAFQKYGIELPFPQRDLRVRSWLGLSGKEAREALRESRRREDDSQAEASNAGDPEPGGRPG